MFEKTIFELNWTMPIFVVMFLVFMKALNAVFLQPIGAVIAKREKGIKDNVAAGQAARQQATELVEGYERDLKEVRAKAQALITETTTAAQKQRAIDLKAVQDQGATQLAKNKQLIDAERVQLAEQMIEEEKSLVQIIVGKLFGIDKTVSLDHATIKHALEESR